MELVAIRAVLDKAGTGQPVSDQEAKEALTEGVALLVTLLTNVERIAGALEQISLNTHPSMN